MLTRAKGFIAEMEAHPKWGKLAQFIKFGIVGVSNTLISLAVYWLCLHLFGAHYMLANAVSFVVSVSNAYYWNSRYVFKSGVSYTPPQHVRAYFKAFTSYGGTFLLGAALLYVWVDKCGISADIAPVINLLITIPLNFVLNKFWAFRG